MAPTSCRVVAFQGGAAVVDEVVPLARPVTLLNLQNESTGKGRKALQMPIYPATLQLVPRWTPCAALKIGSDIKTGLQHMHSHKLAHCDVKAANIFIDGAGNAFLGDYGAVRSFGKDADEKTWSHVPVDPPEGVDVDRATPELDFLLLAVTLLERMKLLQLGPGQLRMASVLTAAEQVMHKELHSAPMSVGPMAVWLWRIW